MADLKIISTEDGSHSIFNAALDETYHSRHGAIQESLHVFIQNGLRFWLNGKSTSKVSILEIGLGTGLNTLLTVQESLKGSIQYYYTSVEAFPVPMDLIQQLNYARQLNWDSGEKLFHEIHSSRWNSPMWLTPQLMLEKREMKIQELELKENQYDVIFFDAFAPNKQPEMWNIPVLKKVTKSMKPDGVLVTYCAKGQLKRDLRSLGLAVESLPGPPGKREMVRAMKSTIQNRDQEYRL